MSDPGAFAAAGTEDQQSGEPTPLAGAGVVLAGVAALAAALLAVFSRARRGAVA